MQFLKKKRFAVHDSDKIVKKILDTKKIDTNSSIALLGLSFKPNTDDIRNSTSIIISESLYQKGANINAYDPKAMNNAKLFFSYG